MINVGTNLNSSKDFTDEYYKILTSDYPTFIDDYISAPEMERLSCSSMACGCNYTNIFDLKFLYTNLDHSIAAALIIWNFTHDKKQTLAGLFHDINTPTFKHCIDFMNGDHINQESTEEGTKSTILNSKEIMSLLEKDNITIDEVYDYKLYPIADNDTPKLSSDRLEYTFSNGVSFKPIWDLEEINRMYKDLTITKNEDGIDELAFSTPAIAEKFVEKASQLWPTWISNTDKVTMQFIADTCRKMKEENFLTTEDLYNLSEMEVIEKIINCPNEDISTNFINFVNSTKVHDSDTFVEDTYCVSVGAKQRYIDPLVVVDNEAKRISEVSVDADNNIKKCLKTKVPKYGYLDFKMR